MREREKKLSFVGISDYAFSIQTLLENVKTMRGPERKKSDWCQRISATSINSYITCIIQVPPPLDAHSITTHTHTHTRKVRAKSFCILCRRSSDALKSMVTYCKEQRKKKIKWIIPRLPRVFVNHWTNRMKASRISRIFALAKCVYEWTKEKKKL